MTFVKRRLDTTLNLAEGEKGDEAGPPITLTGYRTQVAVVAYNGDAQQSLQMRIQGLSQDLMNRLTVIGPILTERRSNRILVAAGNVGNEAMSIVYQGTIAQAWADYNQSPDVSLNIIALSVADEAVRPVAARSYPGAVSVAQIMQDIATGMGLAFENNGVDIVLSSPYFPGTNVDQLRSCARAARIGYTIERGVLAIWPRDGARQGDPIRIEPGLNLIGYPTFTSGGVEFMVLYTPEMGVGRTVQVISTIEAAHGEWTVVSLVHQLESEVPGGAWVTRIRCQRGLFNG